MEEYRYETLPRDPGPRETPFPIPSPGPTRPDSPSPTWPDNDRGGPHSPIVPDSWPDRNVPLGPHGPGEPC